jgi:hypothetical protein
VGVSDCGKFHNTSMTHHCVILETSMTSLWKTP